MHGKQSKAGSYRKKSRFRSPPLKTCCNAVQNLTSLARTLLSATTGSESTVGSDENRGSIRRASNGGDVARKPLDDDINTDKAITTKVVAFHGVIVFLELGLPVEEQVASTLTPKS